MEQGKTRRSKMTRYLLKTALIELMQEKPFKQITIKELCEKADLNRTTFYLHYSEQQEVLNDVVQEVLEKTSEYMKNVSPTAETVELIEAFLIYIQKNDLIFRTLLCSEDTAGFKDDFISYVLASIRDNLPDYGGVTCEPYVLAFLMNGCTHIIIEWIEREYALPPKDLAKIIFALCDSVKDADFR